MSTQNEKLSERAWALLLTTLLSWFLVMQAYGSWVNYWLLHDGKPGTARLLRKDWGGHGRYVYEYTVNGTRYEGSSSRNWKDPKYKNVEPGDDSSAFYSESHPWISSLWLPDTVVTAVPVILIVFGFDFLAIVTLINPRHRWALNLSGGRRKT